jgi:excisionase family DNA binding protein
MNEPKQSPLYTISEAAKKLGISRQAVHGAIKKGLLEAHMGRITRTIVQVTRGWMINAEDLLKYQVSHSHISRGKKT